MDQELYKFRAIIGHEGPLKATDPNSKGIKWNVQIEWETGEITFEPFVLLMHKRRTCIILMDGKHLDISSKRRNNSPEPNICLAFSYQEIILKLWNLTKLTTTVNGMMPHKLNWTPYIHMRYSRSMKKHNMISRRK